MKGKNMQDEDRVKLIIYVLLVPVAALLALSFADHYGDAVKLVRHLGRLLWHPHQASLRQARFYFCVLMGLGIIITQNHFIRRALQHRRRRPDEE